MIFHMAFQGTYQGKLLTIIQASIYSRLSTAVCPQGVEAAYCTACFGFVRSLKRDLLMLYNPLS